MTTQLQLTALSGFPLVESGDNLAELISAAFTHNQLLPESGDILVIAQKVVSKAEGRMVRLDSVTAGAEAQTLAAEVGKDPRLVQLILAESQCVIRKKPGVLVTEHRLGQIMANAGIDASNVSEAGSVLLLPVDSDRSCREIRQSLESRWRIKLGVLINDSFGRPWRLGTAGVALGAAGIPSLWDRRGERDLHGRELMTTQQAIADELAAAASLLQGQGAEGQPVVLVRGLRLGIDATTPNRPAADLLRDRSEDMFR